MKPLRAHNILLKDDLMCLHFHLPLREYHPEHREGRGEEKCLNCLHMMYTGTQHSLFSKGSRSLEMEQLLI